MALQVSSYSMNKIGENRYQFDVKAAEFSNWTGTRIIVGGGVGWACAGIVAGVFSFLSMIPFLYMAVIFATFAFIAYKIFMLSKTGS